MYHVLYKSVTQHFVFMGYVRYCKQGLFPSSSSSSLHGLGESPVPASSIIVSLHRLLGLSMSLFRMVDIYSPVAECGDYFLKHH
jgi:predicted amidohydrolase